ncbi:MAG: 4-hydroxy-tetrahydrodipicolinate synthase [Rhodospirillales bacterium]
MPLTKDDLDGIFTALVTPVDKAGAVDAAATKRLVDHCVSHGTKGLVPNGGTGEYAALTAGERARMVEATVAAAAGRVPVVAGVLAMGLREALAAGRDAQAAGADAIMLLTPFYTIGTQQGIRDYFKAYRDAINLPIMLYEIPRRTNVVVTAETISGMADDGSIIGMKYCNADFDFFIRVMQQVGDRIAVLSGEENLFPAHAALGAPGGVLATSNLFPDVWTKIHELFRSGERAEALRRHAEIFPLLDTIFSEPNPGPLKAALALQGIPVGGVMPPLRDPSEAILARLKEQLSLVEAA